MKKQNIYNVMGCRYILAVEDCDTGRTVKEVVAKRSFTLN